MAGNRTGPASDSEDLDRPEGVVLRRSHRPLTGDVWPPGFAAIKSREAILDAW